MFKKVLFPLLFTMLIAFGIAGCSFLNEEEGTGSITISLGTKGSRTAFSEEDVPVDIFEDLDHWFFEGTVYGEDFSVVQITQISETPSITFFEIPSGKTVYIEVLLRYRDDEWNEATFYKGESEPFVVQKGDNFVTVKMQEYEGDGPNPIEMETDDILFEIGSKLVFKAKSKTGSLIPASDIYFEFHRIGYDAYGPHDDILIPKENNNLETAGDYLLTQTADSYVITTAITNPPDAYEECSYYIFVIARDGFKTYQNVFGPFVFEEGEKTENIFRITAENRQIVKGESVGIFAFDKNGIPVNLSTDAVTVKKFDASSGEYSTTLVRGADYTVANNNDSLKLTLSANSTNIVVNGKYQIFVTANKLDGQPETRRFNITVVRPVLYETVDITGKTGSEVETEINQIEERLVDGCILNLTLTGYNDNGQYNLYELVMDMLRNSGINLYADKPNTPDSSLKTINLDFSSASGSMVETIPDYTFQGIGVIGTLKVSLSTQTVGENAFAQDGQGRYFWIDSLDLSNVRELGAHALENAKFSSQLLLNMVTDFGDNACNLIEAGDVYMYSAEIIAGDNAFANAHIENLSAPMLKVLKAYTFTDTNFGYFYIDPASPLVFIGPNSVNCHQDFSGEMLSMISALPGTWYRIINQNATYEKEGVIYGNGGVKGIFEALYSDDIEWEDLEDAGLIGSDIQALAPEDLAIYIYNDTSLYRKL